MTEKIFSGSSFAEAFLHESITGMSQCRDLEEQEVDRLEQGITDIYAAFPTGQETIESQTEDDLIWPVLVRIPQRSDHSGS